MTLTQALQSQNGELVAKFSLLLLQSESCKERSAWLGSQLAAANEDVKRACDALAAYERSSMELSTENKELAEALEELEAEMAEKVNEQSTQLQQTAIYIVDLHTANELQQRMLIKQQEQASSDNVARGVWARAPAAAREARPPIRGCNAREEHATSRNGHAPATCVVATAD